jgi:hypothetical protein
MRLISRSPVPARRSPNVIGALDPCRCAYRPAFGATMMIMAVRGRNRSPVENAE